jgi:hypothetical protein
MAAAAGAEGSAGAVALTDRAAPAPAAAVAVAGSASDHARLLGAAGITALAAAQLHRRRDQSGPAASHAAGTGRDFE